MNKVIKKYSGQHKSVMLEDIDSKLDLVLEQFSGMRKEIEENHGEFLEFRKETNNNFKTLFDFKDRTDENFKTLFDFKDRTDKNMRVSLEYLSGIDDEIASLKSEIKIAVDAEKRLTKVEKLVFAKLH